MLKDITIQRQENGRYAMRLTFEVGPHAMPMTEWMFVTPRQAIRILRNNSKATLVGPDVIVI